MSTTESSPHVIDEIAEEFVERFRAGQRPAISEYEQRYPEQAAAIRELFPTLLVMEDLKPAGLPAASSQAECATQVAALRKLGDYRIVREIGRGGMGIVYEAVQESLGRQVALKVLPQQIVGDATRQARFEREARAAAKLHHSNIVPVFGVGEDRGLHYYAMQYIHGLGLDKVLSELKRLRSNPPGAAVTELAPVTTDQEPRQPAISAALTRSLFSGQPWPPGQETPAPNPIRPADSTAVDFSSRPSLGLSDTARERLSATDRQEGSFSLPGLGKDSSGSNRLPLCQSVARIGVQVAEALHYAHEAGVLHRDVKPANLLLDIHGAVWVTDFGLAKSDDQRDLTQTGDVLGTLRYMAPEMFSGQSDRRSDVYSLGLTLYELLALRPAFDESDRGGLIRQVLNETPPRLRALDPSIPRDLETIVEKASDREPGQRYATAQELAADLQRYLNDEPIRACRVSTLNRFARWSKRNPVVASLTSAIALLLLLATGVSLVAAARFQGLAERTSKSLQKEREARRENQRQLFRTSLAQAQASRLSGRPGQRLDALEAVRTGAGLLEPLGLGEDERRALRSEAIGALALVDLKKLRSWGGLPMSADVAFSNDFEWLACGAADGKSVFLRRVGNPTENVAELNTEVTPNNTACGFSADGRLLWTFDLAAQYVRLFDRESRKELLEKPANLLDVGAIAIHPQQPRAVIGDAQGTLRNWAFDTLKITDLASAGAGVLAARFSPDGRRLLVSRIDGSLEIRSAETGKVERAWSNFGASKVIDWRSDGAYVAVGLGHDIYLLEVRAPPELAEHFVCRGHQSQVVRVHFHPAHPLLASTSWDGTTRLWDAGSGVESLRIVGDFKGFDEEGRLLAIRRGMTVELWELTLPDALRWLDQRKVAFIDVHPQGRLLAALYHDGVRFWDLAADRFLGHLPLGDVRDLAFDPRGNSLLTAGLSGVWNWPIDAEALERGRVRIGPPQALHADLKPTQRLHVSQEGTMLLAEGLSYRDATLIDRRAERPVLRTLSVPGLNGTALSPDGRWAVTGNVVRGDRVTVWDAHSGAHVRDMPCSGVGPLSFSPDGRRLVGNTGQAVYFWKAGEWLLDQEVPIETNGGSAMGFSPDSRLVATGQWGAGLRLFDLKTAAPIANLEIPESPPAYVDVAFTPDGGRLVGAADVEGLCVWDLRKIRQRLVELGLDWDQPPIPAAQRPRTKRALSIEIDLGTLAPAKPPQP